jgi:DNA mismatch repair protein MSH4
MSAAQHKGIFEASESDGRHKFSGSSSGKEGGGGVTVLAIVENRSREVAVAKIDTRRLFILEMFVLQDNHSYQETLTLIEQQAPDEILLHDGARTRTLSTKIVKQAQTQELSRGLSSREQEDTEQAEAIRVLFISRQYFDQDRGADFLKTVLIGDTVDSDLVSKYTVLACSYCLLRYVETCSDHVFAPHSLKIEFSSGLVSRMIIDRSTAIHLELICNAQNGKEKESLYGVLNKTRTKVGDRLLRSNILRPSTDAATINCRLDVVQSILDNSSICGEICDTLKSFPDIDRCLSGFTTIAKQVNQKAARQSIDTLIFLREILRLAPKLSDFIERLSGRRDGPREIVNDNGGSSLSLSLFDILQTSLKHPCFPSIEKLLDETLTESTSYSKSTHEMRHQECFALRSDSGLLDVARSSFIQCVEDIYSSAASLSEDLGVTIKVVHTASRGYHLSIPIEAQPLPILFTQAVANKRSIMCSTEDITSLSDRATESICSALVITHNLLQDVTSKIRDIGLEALFALADSVGLIDMLISFAELAFFSPLPHCRPALTSGSLVIKQGRHPIISGGSAVSNRPFVSNDTFLSPVDTLMQIVTGPNGAGKSIYLKQVALCVIMGQMG